MRFLLLSLAAISSGSACGNAEKPAPAAPCPTVAPVVIAAPYVSAAPSTSVSPPPPPVIETVPTLAMPTSVACAYETKDIKLVIALRAREKQTQYAHVLSGPLRMTVATNGDDIVEVAIGGIELRGMASIFQSTDPYAMLRPAGPLVLGGIFSVAPDTLLSHEGGSAGELVPVVVGHRHWLNPPRKIEAHACADFSLDKAKFDPKASIPKPSGKFAPQTRYVTNAHSVSIATTATDPPVGQFGQLGLKVTEIDRDAGRSLILANVSNGILFGWVATKDLQKEPIDPFFGPTLGVAAADYPQLMSLKPVVEVTCSQDVRIATIHSDGITFVGRVRAGTRFVYRAGDEKYADLLSVPKTIKLQAGTLGVPVADLSTCKQQKKSD